MKILLRVLFQDDARRALLEQGVFPSSELDAVVLELDSESNELDHFLEATRDASGSWFNPIMKFTKKELDGANFFQLECRKALAENEQDYERNSKRLDQLKPIETSAGRKIKLLDRIALSKVSNLKPNMVAGVDQWTAEFVVGSAAAQAFESEGFTGYSLRPVVNSRTGEAHTEIKQLYTDSLMPAAELNRTTPPSDEGGVRQLGCLVYDADLQSLDLADFNRTAEDWSSNSMPLWVVTARVRACFTGHKLKGWAFRPVLETGTDLHQTYQQLWERLLERVSVNPRNFF